MLKSGPKNRFPIKYEAADGVADDMALRSDCSSSVGAVENKKISRKCLHILKKSLNYELSAIAAVFCDNFV